MTEERGVTHYDQMPIPPVDAHTIYFEAGPISIGVEYRLLDDAIAAVSRTEVARGDASGATEIEDCGVSLHVFGTLADQRLEYLRFDCFDEDPHYHYISWRDHSNRMIHIDPVIAGDPMEWAIERIRTRLPEMLEEAGAAELAVAIQPRAIEEILPRVREAGHHARLHHDSESIRRAALGASGS